MSQSEIVEHIVLFKVKDDVDSDQTSSMINGLNGLVAIDQVIHLSAGPVHKLTSASSSLAFTHVLHSRYGSKEDLGVYAAHPEHVRVVKESLPFWEDIMAVDWVTDRVPGRLAPLPGSVGKITLLKVKENVPEEAKTEVVEAMIGEKPPGIDQVTVGENFSPARAKGFSIASIAYFRDLAEMEPHRDLVKEKVGDYLDDSIVVQFVVSPSTL